MSSLQCTYCLSLDAIFLQFLVKVGTLKKLQLEAPVVIGTTALGGVFYPPPSGAAVVTKQPLGPVA